MNPADYDSWYSTPRGAWIGETEFRLMRRLAGVRQRDTLLDVGCGTGWFTRRFAHEWGWNVTGLDADPERLAYARAHRRNERYMEGDARALPFADDSFDVAVSFAALCFIDDWQGALREMVRVARRRVVVGTINRNSLLWRQKRDSGGYRGAYWHTADELRAAAALLPLDDIELASAIFLPGGSLFARASERIMPGRLLAGGFLALAADVRP